MIPESFGSAVPAPETPAPASRPSRRPTVASSSVPKKQTVRKLQGEHLVNLSGVVAVALQVAAHYGFQPLAVQVWPGKSARVKEHFLNVSGEPVPVPNPEMVILVTAEEKTLQMKRGERMVNLCHPLWHAVVISIFRLESEGVVAAKNGARERLAFPSNPDVCPYPPQGGIAVGDQAQAKRIILDGGHRRAKVGPHQIVIQERR